MHQISFCCMSVYCFGIYKWWLSQVRYLSTNWTQAVSYSSLEIFMVSTTDSSCLYWTGAVFISKLFEMLQIVLLGLVLKSGSEWPHKIIYTFSDECENSWKRSNSTRRLYTKMKHEHSSGATHICLERAPTSAGGPPMAAFPPGLMCRHIQNHVSDIYVLLCCRVSCDHQQVIFFFAEGGSWVFVQTLTLFRWWYWVFGSCARWGPKGLPYIIHYALTHQPGCKAALLWSPSKKALVISLPLGGQLLEQKRQKLQSTPPCSDCSEGERERKRRRGRESGGGGGGRGAYFLAWRDIDSIAGSLCVWFLAQDVQKWGEWGLYRHSSFSETCSFITQRFRKQEKVFLWWNVSYHINTSRALVELWGLWAQTFRGDG